MHWPSSEGVADEHWWMEVHGRTVEIIPTCHDVRIYGPKGDEADNYSQVRLPLTGLPRRQVTRIERVLDEGSLFPVRQVKVS
jgi:hypothetical protein